MSPKTADFGSYIRECRQKKEMNISQLAEAAEISAAQVSRIECGLRLTPKPQTLKALANALDVDFEDLMRRAGYFD
ncbi:putative transcriptional regulator [Paenibacillus sp. 598K]|uniref:helix-turn-helix domain-containing protein n=1 Tax=Paenibacillus sp. 598K TaxID=1117987 RepID=UPI000FF95F01|nr:helix-turn-helix transcriptional regulator [Paenibacillus sp. 598K]GBF73185.1 putative transcriptional regulator [Paenibacillus sp. 598K]